MRVLQVVTDTDRRGAQVFAVDLGRELTRSGRNVRTVALAPGSKPGLDVPGLDVPVLGAKRLGSSTLRALRREVRDHDVVVAHGSTTLFACAVATALTDVPFVYRQISDSRFWAPRGPRRTRVRMAFRRCARVVALWSGSASVLEAEFGVPRHKIRVIPNGARADTFVPTAPTERHGRRVALGLDPDRPTVVYVGALVPEKGVDVVIDAIGGVERAQLLVAGDGPSRASLEGRAVQVAPGRVVFSGTIADARDAYAAADVVVLASRGGDSMPAVLIEAGLMGIVTVATPVEAIPEIVLPGTTGLLVDVDDSDALADSLRTLLADDGLRARFGGAAREHCLELFSLEGVAALWGSVLEELG